MQMIDDTLAYIKDMIPKPFKLNISPHAGE